MKEILSYWNLGYTNSVLFILILLTWLLIMRRSVRPYYFFGAVALLALCLFSPLQLLSDYLFSAHMIIHVLLLLCAGPLLLMSLPKDYDLQPRLFLFIRQYPIFSWLTGIGIMWFWHVPVLFNHSMANMQQSGFDWKMFIEMISLIIAGILFSSPLLHPDRKYRIDALSGVLYLFTACIGCSLLGLLITFAPDGTYHHFLSMHDHLGLNDIITQQWKITQSADQQAAGLIMWVPCCFIYVSGVLYLIRQWYIQKEDVTVQLNNL